jgi:hypothetical protein
MLPGGITGSMNTLNINGLDSGMTNYLIDGTFNMNTGCQCALNILSPIDTISEFKVLKDNFSAKYGISGNADVLVETKSGTKDFHGSAYDYLRNQALDASNFFSAGVKTPLKQNIFGFSIGGPLVIPNHFNTDRKKTFFFASEEWRRRDAGLTVRGSMIPQAMRNGDFTSSPTTPATGLAFDPTATNLLAQEHPGVNCLPDPFHLNPACFDKNAITLMNQYWPLPNNPSGGFLNYLNPGVDAWRTRNDTYRVDHYFSEKYSLMLRVAYEGDLENLPYLSWGIAGLNPAPTTWQYNHTTGFNGLARFTTHISPTTLNVFSFDETYDKVRLIPEGATYLSGLTIQRPFPDQKDKNPDILLSDGWAGYGSYRLPVIASDAAETLGDDFTHVKGNHVIQAGMIYIFGLKRQNLFAQTNGSYTFTGVHTGDPVADYLLGLDSNYYQTSGERRGYFRYRQFEPYIQDDWKVTRRLTLNLGLRDVYYSSDTMQGNGIADFDPRLYNSAQAPVVNPNGTFVLGANGVPITATGQPANLLNGIIYAGKNGVADGFYVTPKLNLGPRVGFAYDVSGNGKTAIRGGAGLGYTRNPMGIYFSINNPPYTSAADLLNGTLTNPSAGEVAPETGSPLSTVGPANQLWRPQRVGTYSLGVERRLSTSGVLNLSYVGSQARHINGVIDYNQPLAVSAPSVSNPGCLQPGQNIPAGGFNFDPCLNQGITSPDFTRPFKGWEAITSGGGTGVNSYFGNANYNALQAGWRYRARNQLTWTASYTYSRALTDIPSGERTGAQNSRDFEAEYGRANWDLTHVFTSGYIWDMPFLRQQRGVLNKALGAWTFSGYTIIESGYPVDPGLSIGTPGLATRPDLVANSAGPRTVQEWFNPASLAAPPYGFFGNAAPNCIKGPPLDTWDWALYKTFPMGERFKLQFRSEFFNIWNHPNFNGVSASVGAPNIGMLTSANDPRIVEFALRLDF